MKESLSELNSNIYIRLRKRPNSDCATYNSKANKRNIVWSPYQQMARGYSWTCCIIRWNDSKDSTDSWTTRYDDAGCWIPWHTKSVDSVNVRIGLSICLCGKKQNKNAQFFPVVRCSTIRNETTVWPTAKMKPGSRRLRAEVRNILIAFWLLLSSLYII